MNNADYIRTLFDSLYWARDRVLAAAEGMSEEEYGRENGFVYKSMRGILTHTLGAEAGYFYRVSGRPVPAPESAEAVNEKNLPTIEALAARWRDEEKSARAFLEKMTDGDLEREVVFTRRDGAEVRQPLWQILTLVYQHTLQHRSEAAEALTMAGRSPGALDFPVYINEGRK